MAKLALIFLFVLVLIQYVSAGTVKRDAPPDLQISLEKALGEMRELLEKVLPKENLEKVTQDLQKLGETLTAKGKELVHEANEHLKKPL